MSKSYSQAVDHILVYLDNNHYTPYIANTYKRCFRLLQTWLEDNQKSYSRHIALLWFNLIKDELSLKAVKIFRVALSKLDVVIENHEITKVSHSSKNLNTMSKKILESFLYENANDRSLGVSRQKTLKNSISRFLIYLLQQKIEIPSGITHKILVNYYRNDIHRSQCAKNIHMNEVKTFLQYLADKKIIKESIPLCCTYVRLHNLILLEELPDKERKLFYRKDTTFCLSPKSFYLMSSHMQSILKKQKYSSWVSSEYHRLWCELFIFLEANNLDYSSQIALLWGRIQKRFHIEKIIRRSIELIERIKENENFKPQIMYLYNNDSHQKPQDWCIKEYENFMMNRQKQNLASSTIKLYRIACLRFLKYLSQNALTAWNNVTPQIIKSFNIANQSLATETQNTYCSNVRMFLIYLGENKIVHPCLYLALSHQRPFRVKIINILNCKELEIIHKFKRQAKSPLQLRMSAMIMLGLRMGLRGIDIVNLKLTDISWKNKTITIQQKKTGKLIKLPMPTEVGNTIYKYILEGRPVTDSEYIFVTHKRPYRKFISASPCAKALQTVLSVPSGGFHITRKTFASRMLVNETSPEIISELLGHRNNSTVMTYLSTDDKTMRRCAISLDGIEIKQGVLA
jgi:site-specific recombinase XerD